MINLILNPENNRFFVEPLGSAFRIVDIARPDSRSEVFEDRSKTVVVASTLNRQDDEEDDAAWSRACNKPIAWVPVSGHVWD